MMVMVWVSLAAQGAAGVGGFVRQRWRLFLVLVAAALLALPLLRGGISVLGLNGLSFGFGATLDCRLLFWWARRMIRR